MGSSPAQHPGALESFKNELDRTADLTLLGDLAAQLAYEPTLAILVLQRMATLSPHNLNYQIRLGFAHYSNGDDAPATDTVNEILKRAPQNIDALNLLAALTPDPDERRKIFAKILTIDPHNRAAFDNLVLLRPPEEHDDH